MNETTIKPNRISPSKATGLLYCSILVNKCLCKCVLVKVKIPELSQPITEN